jgi:hypothetical protein
LKKLVSESSSRPSTIAASTPTEAQGLPKKYGLKADAPADRPWAIRDFVIVDPTGVLWRIGQNID